MADKMKNLLFVLTAGSLLIASFAAEAIMIQQIFSGKNWFMAVVYIGLALPFAPIVVPLVAWYFWPGPITSIMYIFILAVVVCGAPLLYLKDRQPQP